MLATMAPVLRPAGLVRALAAVMDRLFTDRSRSDFVHNLMVETDAEACDAREILPDIKVPVLLIGGDQGPFLSREILEETARLIPDCTLQLHEGKGDMGAVSSMQLPRDVLAWIEERSRVRPRSEPPRPVPITEETAPAAPATVPEPSLAARTPADMIRPVGAIHAQAAGTAPSQWRPAGGGEQCRSRSVVQLAGIAGVFVGFGALISVRSGCGATRTRSRTFAA